MALKAKQKNRGTKYHIHNRYNIIIHYPTDGENLVEVTQVDPDTHELGRKDPLAPFFGILID